MDSLLTLHCVDDAVPSETVDLLRAASGERGVGFARIDAGRFDFTTAAPLPPGSLLYRPAVSTAAMRVEQALLGDGVATFHRSRLAWSFHPASASLHFERSGLPVPRTVPVVRPDRDRLRHYVDWLGGLPVVLKVPGGEGGVGVMRVDSLASLFSVVDYLHGSGREPMLMAYVADAVHWRVIVVGDRAVSAYRNPIERDDFRSIAGGETASGAGAAPAAVGALAIAATRASWTHFAGVDILEHTSGRLYLLEANFPCYFAHAQQVTGIDVAGAMLDFLLGVREHGAPRSEDP